MLTYLCFFGAKLGFSIDDEDYKRYNVKMQKILFLLSRGGGITPNALRTLSFLRYCILHFVAYSMSLYVSSRLLGNFPAPVDQSETGHKNHQILL